MAAPAAALELTKPAPAAPLMGAQDTVSAPSQAFHVYVTICDSAGTELLCNVSLVVSLQTSVGDFAKAIVDKLAPAPKGCYFEFTSCRFRGALAENQLNICNPDYPDVGITKKNEELLSTICSGSLHPDEQLELQRTIVQTELSVTRREETDAYMRLLQQTCDDRVYYYTPHHNFTNYADAVGYWETREDDLARTRKEEINALRLCTVYPGNNRDNRSCRCPRVAREFGWGCCFDVAEGRDCPRVGYKDVVKCSAEYVCPFALCPSASVILQNRMQSCPCTFNRREDLLEHLQSVHRNDKIGMVGVHLIDAQALAVLSSLE